MKNNPTIEKVLAEALELRDKGVSVPAILGTYATHADDISELFRTTASLETKKNAIRPDMAGLRAILAELPETETAAERVPQTKSPYVQFWSTMHLSAWKLVLPVAAIALFVAGGFMVRKNPAAPIAPSNALPAGSDQTIAMTAPQQKKTSATPDDRPEASSAPTAKLFALSAAQDSTNTAFDAYTTAAGTESDADARSIKQSDSERQLAMADPKYMSDPTQKYGF